MEADALFKRGWKISAIARHLGHDRGTITNYLTGKSTPGVRCPAGPDPLAEFVPYVVARFADDPHLWASALFDEVVACAGGAPPNELWFSSSEDETDGITANRAGVAVGRGSADWVVRGDARAVVIHAIPVGGNTAGGPKIACADLEGMELGL